MSDDELESLIESVSSEEALSAGEREIHKLRKKVAEERRAKAALLKELEISDARLDAALCIADHDHGTVKTPSIVTRGQSGANEATAVIMCSDWHVEEVVDPLTVNGRNTYNPAIAEERAMQQFKGSAWMIEAFKPTKRKIGWDVRELIVWFGGDMITGHIHEELMEGNAMSPTEAILFWLRLAKQGLNMLLKETKVEKINVFCNYGNHGRTTAKRRVATAAKNSFEWLAYHALAQEYANEPRIQFSIADGAHLYTEVYDWTIRWHHGDDIRYHGGVGGLSIPIRKATDAWDTNISADLTVIGHYHQFVDYGYAICNGSLIGWNSFALSVKARYEPPQQGFFIMDKRFGKRLVTPISVEPPSVP